MSVPKINLINSDFPLGVEILSLIASIGLTWEAFLAGSRDERIVTVTPIAKPTSAASVVKTKGPSGNTNSKYCKPSLTATASQIQSPIPKPEPTIDIKRDSEITSLYICLLDVPSALSRDSSLVLCKRRILNVF